MSEEDETGDILWQMSKDGLLNVGVNKEGEFTYVLTTEGLKEGENVLGGKDIGEAASALTDVVLSHFKRNWDMEFDEPQRTRLWLYMTFIARLWREFHEVPWDGFIEALKPWRS